MVDNHTYDVDPWLQTWPLECVISSTWPLGDPWMPPKKGLATQECIEISLYSALGTANHLIIQPRVLRPGSVLSIGSNFTIMIPWFSKLQWENHFTLHPQVLRPESVFTGTQKVDFSVFFLQSRGLSISKSADSTQPLHGLGKSTRHSPRLPKDPDKLQKRL